MFRGQSLTMDALLKRYGPAAVATYLTINVAAYTSVYIALANGADATALLQRAIDAALWTTLDVRPLLRRIGVLDQDNEPSATMRQGSTLVVTIACVKMLFPLKLSLAAVLTPRVAPFVTPFLEKALARWKAR
mmetsp:Transcript_23555/g.80447  ORF Transcript_23555/g.80447 Transcript_23555/m.80447 type:complete len:133 (+) Transcript_23555:12-410(+)